MKSRPLLLILIILICCSNYLKSQGDDCDRYFRLGQAPNCLTTIYHNQSATPSNIGDNNFPNCYVDPPSKDLWFSFVADQQILDYTIEVEGTAIDGINPISNIQVAIYRGRCVADRLALLNCFTGAEGSETLRFDLEDLTPGDEYFLRVDNYGGADKAGGFSICISEFVNEVNLTDGQSSRCSGVLYDSGGPDGDYANEEDFVFSICPDQPNACVNFAVEYFQLADHPVLGGDQLIFYKGANTNAPIIGRLGPDNTTNSYGNGGVCYEVQAAGCLTVQFLSNRQETAAGFKGRWTCSTANCTPPQSLDIITNEVNNQDLQDVLGSPTAIIEIDTVICSKNAIGIFENGDLSNLGIQQGLLLTTGDPFNAIGPNIAKDRTTDNNTRGDRDLDILSNLVGNGQRSEDACIVELDVQVFTNELRYEYVFGSEEYPEFVGTAFNDIFALLISGPNIDGIPEIDNQANMATLPGSETVVEINNVSHLKNWEYFRNNSAHTGLEYDGMTSDFMGIKKSLTASAEVIPCETYHLKFAIADRSDRKLDSGVFISEIRSGTPSLEVLYNTDVQNFVEGCSNDQSSLDVVLSRSFADTVYYDVVVTGTATQGVDYIADIPNRISFAPGQSRLNFPFYPLADDIDEEEEIVIIQLRSQTECGDIVVEELHVRLYDEVVMSFGADGDTLNVCRDVNYQLNLTGVDQVIWKSTDKVNDILSKNPTINTSENYWLVAEGQFADNPQCAVTDSIYVQIIDPQLSINEIDPTVCPGDVVKLNTTSNLDLEDENIEWRVDGQLLSKTDGGIEFLRYQPGNYTITAKLEDKTCTIIDTSLVIVEDFRLPSLSQPNPTLCEGELLILGSSVTETSTQYVWTSEMTVINQGSSEIEIAPKADTQIELYASSVNGTCVDSFIWNVDVIAGDISIIGEDSLHICLGEELELTTMVTSMDTVSTPISWIGDAIIRVDTSIANVKASRSTYIYAFKNFGDCQAIDSVYISVDSIPTSDLLLIPEKSIYCAGEEIAIISTNGRLLEDAQVEWSSRSGQELPDLGINGVLTLTQSDTLIRIIESKKCIDSTFLDINVSSLNPEVIAPGSICTNGSFEVEIKSELQIDQISWSPDVACLNNSCTVAILEPLDEGTYEAIVSTGSCIDTVIVEAIPERVEVEIMAEQGEKVPLGTEVSINIISNAAPQTFSWSVNGQAVNGDAETMQFLASQNQNIVEYIFTSENGCEYIRTIAVQAFTPEIRFPNIFRPDSSTPINTSFRYIVLLDGEPYDNDINMEISSFRIFNRWGKAVYECASSDCNRNGWNGALKQTAQPSASYSYFFNAALADGTPVSAKGSFLLLR